MKSKGGTTKTMRQGNVKNYRMKSPILIICIILFGALIFFSFLKQPAYAGEGGSSSYTPGTYGDFSMNYAEPGLYLRENIIYYKGKLDDFPLFPTVNANLEQTTWFNLLTVTYIAQQKLLGGHYFFTTSIPYGFSVKLDTDVPAMGFSQHDSVSKMGELGVGDIWVAPVGLMWHVGSFHITLTENIVLPTGDYSSNDVINMGRNYTSYETDIGLTWLDEENGHEVSFVAGYMINERNEETDYKTGDEFHIDFALNQYFSERFGVGITGYYCQQITDDSSPDLDTINAVNSAFGLPTPDGYKGSSAGVGPAIMWGLSKDIQVIAKWIYEYHAENRFKGDWAFVSLNVKF